MVCKSKNSSATPTPPTSIAHQLHISLNTVMGQNKAVLSEQTRLYSTEAPTKRCYCVRAIKLTGLVSEVSRLMGGGGCGKVRKRLLMKTWSFL